MRRLRRRKPHELYMDGGPFSEIRTDMIKLFENNNYFEDEDNNYFLKQASRLNQYFVFLIHDPFSVDRILESIPYLLPQDNTVYYVISGVKIIERLKEELDRAHSTA